MLLEVREAKQLIQTIHLVKEGSVLICTDEGTPLGFLIQFDRKHYRILRFDDADFLIQLQHHGIDKQLSYKAIHIESPNQEQANNVQHSRLGDPRPVIQR